MRRKVQDAGRVGLRHGESLALGRRFMFIPEFRWMIAAAAKPAEPYPPA